MSRHCRFRPAAGTLPRIDMGELLSVVIADDKAGGLFLDRPRGREAAGVHCAQNRWRIEQAYTVRLSTILVLIFLFGPFSAPILLGLARDRRHRDWIWLSARSTLNLWRFGTGARLAGAACF
jgi:hypothetical protein